MILKIDEKFEEKPIFCFKIDKNLVNFDTNNQKSQKFAYSLVRFVQSKSLTWKIIGELSFMTLKSHVKYEKKKKTCLWFGKWHEHFGKFLPEHLKILKVCTLMSCFWQKYKMLKLKNYKQFMFDGTEYYCKMWGETDLYFQKWHDEFGKFSQKHIWKSFYPK